MMKAVRAVLCRHTETNLNKENKYTGQLDVPLNSRGILQAQALGELLSHKNVSAIFSSDLQRAIQATSYIAIHHTSITPKTDARLREVDLGVANGMRKNDMKISYPHEKFSTQNPHFDFSEIGGESRIAVVKRHVEFFNELTEIHGASNEDREIPHIVVVGHGTALRCFLENLGIQSQLEQGNYQIISYFSEN